VFNVKHVRRFLERRFGRDPNAFDTPVGEKSCLFGFSVTADGRPLLDTFTLASCPWAVGRTLNPGPRSNKWLEGFENAARDQAFRFSESLAASPDDERARSLRELGIRIGRQLDFNDLIAETTRIASEFGVVRVLAPEEILVKARQVGERYQYQGDTGDLLNSFYMKDLAKVASELEANGCGRALSEYLSEDELQLSRRIDVREDTAAVWRQMSPSLFPQGKWPGRPDQPLYFSQQLAVNSALAGLRDSAEGLFSVNGPPGTGKTTILREMIAAIIVERAKRIAPLKRPQDAFSARSPLWKVDGARRPVSTWKEEFLGFEIVVASNNNAAVENVTLEIPGAGAIAREWQGATSYFADFATRVLGGTEAWALMAARLGKRENCNRFRSRFWFRERDPDAPVNRANLGFLKYLQSVKSQPRDWPNAVRAFERALQKEQKWRDERVQAWQAVNGLDRLECELATIRRDIEEHGQKRAACLAEFSRAERHRDEAANQRRQAAELRIEHQQFKPGVVDALFTWGDAFRKWQAKDEDLLRDVEARDIAVAMAEKAAQEARKPVDALDAEIEVESRILSDCEERVARQQILCDSLRLQMGKAFPDRKTWRDKDLRELSAPWADEEWDRARTNVFLEALNLHRAFIEAASTQIQRNLHRAMDVIAGKIPGESEPEGIRSVWATLFFVVPVISTTFASLDRLFAHLGREELGWLLIDEAGQTIPQAAAGALWRSRRALVVGDPMQLEPIFTLPSTAQFALQRRFGVSETWVPKGSSTQVLADRVSRFGTAIARIDEPSVWVGSPLRVHRRCDRAIFQISNEIGYAGQMVYATPEHPLELEPSSWIDIQSMEAEGHWIPAEGVAANLLITDLLRRGAQPEQIFLLSPFRAVARHLEEIKRRHKLERTGTIHRAQGKEADIVIVVLGGDPRSQHAKAWASDKPNLLNVAVSRARRRLYIIGNRDEWAAYPHFSEAASVLERRADLVRPATGAY
jgi:hypothetical protein